MFLIDILLSPWLIFTVFLFLFLGVSRWALFRLKEYAGYALGILLGIFVMIIYASLGGGNPGIPADEPTVLNFLQVIFPAFFGMLLGATIMIVVQFGKQRSRSKALQVTFITMLNVIMLILLPIQGPAARRMIGIFALTFGIAALATQVLFRGVGENQHQQAPDQPQNPNVLRPPNNFNAQDYDPTQQTANRFNQIRNNNSNPRQ